MRYLLRWSARVYGESLVDAKNKDEAMDMGYDGEDFDFDRFEDTGDWSIDAIEEAPDRKSYDKGEYHQ